MDGKNDPDEHPNLEISGLDIDKSESFGFSKSERFHAAFGKLLNSIKGK